MLENKGNKVQHRAALRLFSRKMKNTRKDMGWTLEQAAERAGLSRNTLVNLESGRNPTLCTVLSLFNAYDMTPEILSDCLELTEALPESRHGVSTL